MDDEQIVALYWQREEAAIRETEQKYGRYLTKIAYNILADYEDSRESVNDTYLAAWNSIPPHKPSVLSTYLAKLTRRLSIDCWRSRNREKRRDSQYAISLSELEECVSGGDTTQEGFRQKLLADAIAVYLRAISQDARNAFIGRYYFMDPLKEVAAYCGMSESRAKSLLHRTRLGLRDYLIREGFEL